MIFVLKVFLISYAMIAVRSDKQMLTVGLLTVVASINYAIRQSFNSWEATKCDKFIDKNGDFSHPCDSKTFPLNIC